MSIRSKDKKSFIEKAISIHGIEKYNYSEVEYVNAKTKVKIFCNKCKKYFYQNPNAHLSSGGCRKCGVDCRSKNRIHTQQYVLEKFKEIHSENYDYSKFVYENKLKKSTIICKKCKIEFLQNFNSHAYAKNGCPKCGLKQYSLRSTSEEFVEKSKKIHGNNFDYSNVIYKGAHKKVKIVCNKCKTEFEQSPTSHLNKNGCKVCNLSSWRYSNWEKAALNSKNFDSYKVYVIECYNDEERFIKIGRTYQTIKERFDSKNALPYDYIILKSHANINPRNICELEQELKNQFIKYKYLTLIPFGGQTECLNISAKDAILKYINNYETRN